jgi:hypothetical protein
MRTTRREILPLAERAVREALRSAIREAIVQVSQERDVLESLRQLHRNGSSRRDPQEVGPTPAPPMRTFQVPFRDLPDDEAWEQFDAIRFARYAAR